MPTDPLPQRLRDYAALTPDERALVDADAAVRPDLADDWREARALAALADRLRQPRDLATRVVDARLGHGPLVREEAPEIRDALDRLEAETEDPVSQFERLTGHTLEAPAPRPSGDGLASGSLRLAADRQPERSRALIVARRLAFAAVVCAGLYGAGFGASSLLMPERARVAHVDDVADTFRPVRGASLSDRYAEAVARLEDARQSTLGLFPHYDDAALDRAADAFAEIAREAPNDQYGKEATLALGRIRVLQGRDEEARTALDVVVAGGGYRAPDAVRLLDFLDAKQREGAGA